MPSPLYLIQLNASNTLPDKGGVATYTHELAQRMARDGARVILLTYPTHQDGASSHGTAYAVRRAAAFDLAPLIARGGGRKDLITRLPLKVMGMTRETVRALRQAPPPLQNRIVWAVNWWPEAVAAALAARICRVPFVVTAHGFEAIVEPGGALHAIYRQVMNRAARVFAVSRHTAAQLERCGVLRERIRVIHNGVTPEIFTPGQRATTRGAEARQRLAAEGNFLVLTVARLSRRKGHALVLEALDRLRDRIPNLRYVIAGDGPQRQRLEHQVRELGLEGRVTFTGTVTDDEKLDLLHACDVLVMPNRDVRLPDGRLDTEGFGIVFLEASACGKPVVAGRAGGAVEAVLEGRTGMLVDPLDPTELAGALRRLWEDPAFARRLGEEGMETVRQRFSWRRLSVAYLDEMRASLPHP